MKKILEIALALCLLAILPGGALAMDGMDQFQQRIDTFAEQYHPPGVQSWTINPYGPSPNYGYAPWQGWWNFLSSWWGQW